MFIAMCTPTTSDGIPTNSALSAGWLESHVMDNKLQLQVDIVVVKKLSSAERFESIFVLARPSWLFDFLDLKPATSTIFQKRNQVLENSVHHTNKFGGKHDRWKNVSFEVSISLNIV